jgi:hypothetical protein
MKYYVSNYKNFEVIFVERKLKLKKKVKGF